MMRLNIGIVALLFVCACHDTSHDSTVRAVRAEAAEPENTSGASCPLEKVRYVSTGEAWKEECMDAPLPRETAHWGSNGAWVANVHPAHCTPHIEDVRLTVLEAGKLREHTLPVTSIELGKGGLLTAFRDRVVVLGGESCPNSQSDKKDRYLSIDDHTGALERVRMGHRGGVWPVVIERKGKLLRLWADKQQMGELDLWSYPGLDFKPTDLCRVLGPEVYKEEAEDESSSAFYEMYVCGTGKTWSQLQETTPEIAFYRGDRDWKTYIRKPFEDGSPTAPSGRELTYAYDPVKDRLVTVGAVQPSEFYYPMGMDHLDPLYWQLTDEAWSYPYHGAPRRLPKPPVVGDGVTLVWDPLNQRTLLVDPFGSQHYMLAEDDSTWEPFPHAPLPIEVPQTGRLRFTQYTFPYFAHWDTTLGAIVLYPYAQPYSLCLQVEGDTERVACPKAHP